MVLWGSGRLLLVRGRLHLLNVPAEFLELLAELPRGNSRAATFQLVGAVLLRWFDQTRTLVRHGAIALLRIGQFLLVLRRAGLAFEHVLVRLTEFLIFFVSHVELFESIFIDLFRQLQVASPLLELFIGLRTRQRLFSRAVTARLSRLGILAFRATSSARPAGTAAVRFIARAGTALAAGLVA